jgi:hypothetical protein
LAFVQYWCWFSAPDGPLVCVAALSFVVWLPSPLPAVSGAGGVSVKARKSHVIIQSLGEENRLRSLDLQNKDLKSLDIKAGIF